MGVGVGVGVGVGDPAAGDEGEDEDGADGGADVGLVSAALVPSAASSVRFRCSAIRRFVTRFVQASAYAERFSNRVTRSFTTLSSSAIGTA